MSFNRLFDPLRLDADIPLRDGGGTVLQQPLDKGNVEAVVPVNLRRVPFAEAVGADALKAQVIADNGKLLLDGAFRNQTHRVNGDGPNDLHSSMGQKNRPQSYKSSAVI